MATMTFDGIKGLRNKGGKPRLLVFAKEMQDLSDVTQKSSFLPC